MKKHNKILAVGLILAVVLSLCTFTVYAEGEEAATSVQIIKNDFEKQNAGKSSTAFKIDSGSKVSGNLNLRKSSFGSNGITEYNIVQRDSGDKYFEFQSSYFGYNVRKTPTDFDTYGQTNYPVMSIGYDIMIPSDDTYKANRRFAAFPVGSGTADSYTTAICTIMPSIENGKVFAEVAEIKKPLYSTKLDYTYGEWLSFNVLTWVDDDQKMVVYVFANDKLLYVGKSSTASMGLSANDFNFGYYNAADGFGQVIDKKATWENGLLAGSNSILSTTAYDNIKVQLLPESAKIDYTVISYADCDVLAPISEKYKDNASDNNGVRTTVAKKASDLIAVTGEIETVFVHGGASTAETQYEIITEDNGRKALKASTTGYIIAPQNTRQSIAEFFRGGDKHTLIGSYEMKIPEESKEIKREVSFGLGMENTNGNGTSRVSMCSRIENGSISFETTSNSKGASTVKGAERSESRTIASDEWLTVTIVAEITQKTNGYEVNTYGIYDDEVIYVNEHFIDNADNNGDGVVTDDLCSSQNYFMIGDSSTVTDTAHVTYLDNFKLEKDNNFDWTGIDKNAWVNRKVELTLDADGNVDVDASKKEGSFPSGSILVVALYDAKGKVVEIIKSTEITEGKFIYEVPATKVATAKIIKAFVFDGITTAVPLMKHGVIEID